MSEAAKRRLEAFGQQLSDDAAGLVVGSPPSASGKAGPSQVALTPIYQVASESTSPRALGKVVIITGANSMLGIGRASAHQFAQNGARAVYLCDFTDENLAAHKADLDARYPEVDILVRTFDAADEAAVKGVIDDALERYGRLDVFFANAGIVGPSVTFDAISAEQYMHVQRVNSLGPFLAAKYAAPAMQKTSSDKSHPNGSIIMTASVAGLRSNAGSTPYSVSKAGVISIAQTMAYQLVGTGIRINAICPGLIETGMTEIIFQTARKRGTQHKIGQLNPMRRAGHSDEIARTVLFLGSDESSYVTGQAWAVDGGLSAGHPYVPGKLS